MENATKGSPPSKESLNVPESAGSDLKSSKFPAHAKGGSLAEGCSMISKTPDVGNMYPVNGDIAKMPKGNDRI
ncbi:hypothetical protein [Sphingomonas sp.]|jgi:hypothetical protein|uniref:hypothetical protein n=1 Tax=Sphingomonas sp. TaxID=28214 RepID=UPI0035623AC5